MDLYSELRAALQSERRGDEMERILKRAAATGVKPGEALKALSRLFWEADTDGREKDEDLIVDLKDIARGYCQPQYRIWTHEETIENNEQDVRDGVFW